MSPDCDAYKHIEAIVYDSFIVIIRDGVSKLKTA